MMRRPELPSLTRFRRLRGHRDQITAIQFLYPSPEQPSTSKTTQTAGHLVTTSKDTFLKLWDLASHHCIQTVVAHRADIWSMHAEATLNLIFTGSGEGELKAWKIDVEALVQGLQESPSGEVSSHFYAFYPSHTFLDHKDSPTFWNSSVGIIASGRTNYIPSHRTVHVRAIPRTHSGGISTAERGGDQEKDRQT